MVDEAPFLRDLSLLRAHHFCLTHHLLRHPPSIFTFGHRFRRTR